jgi:hypothetical protein
MGLLGRFFGTRRAEYEAAAAAWARSTKRAGREAGRPVSERAATRGRVEAEMDGHRMRREQLATPSD